MAARQQSIHRLEELIKIAQETKGWGVTHGERDVYFLPPNADPATDRIATRTLLGERQIKQLEKALEKAGLPMTLPKNPAHPIPRLLAVVSPSPIEDLQEKPSPESEPKIEPVVPDLNCPECGQPAKSPAGLGAHRRRKHGVIGTSQDAVKRRTQEAEKAGEGDQPEATPEEIADDVLSDVDAAMVLLRAEVEAIVHKAREVSQEEGDWQRRAEEAGEALGAIRKAIADLPMAQAFARISEIVGADRE